MQKTDRCSVLAILASTMMDHKRDRSSNRANGDESSSLDIQKEHSSFCAARS